METPGPRQRDLPTQALALSPPVCNPCPSAPVLACGPLPPAPPSPPLSLPPSVSRGSEGPSASAPGPWLVLTRDGPGHGALRPSCSCSSQTPQNQLLSFPVCWQPIAWYFLPPSFVLAASPPRLPGSYLPFMKILLSLRRTLIDQDTPHQILLHLTFLLCLLESGTLRHRALQV